MTQARARRRQTQVRRRDSACSEETGEGRTWAGPGGKEPKMDQAQWNSEFFYLFKSFLYEFELF
jgi:hypothetical protein